MVRLLVIPLVLWATSALAESELIMLEQDGCYWCDRWHDEIGHIYPKTWEAEHAPIRMVDIHAPKAADDELADSVIYTPTFVLVIDGVEAGRLEGYAGEDFFWVLLDDMMKKAGIKPDIAG